jgi:hypothetical protein
MHGMMAFASGMDICNLVEEGPCFYVSILKLEQPHVSKARSSGHSGLDERAFQDILFRSLDRLLPDEELILISQSRRWQEEPDLLALNETAGSLFLN